MKNSDFRVIIPSHRPELAPVAAAMMAPIVPIVFTNEGYPSFSKLINDCIVQCPAEIVIICNDKCRPLECHELETVRLINDGFGFAALHNFRHFGFHKDLVRRIGFFDERYEGGEYEDFDFLRRIQEADIAVYMSAEIPCIELATSWNSQKTMLFNHLKWSEWGGHTDRILPDEPHDKYNIGSDTGMKFKKYKDSVHLNIGTPREFLVK